MPLSSPYQIVLSGDEQAVLAARAQSVRGPYRDRLRAAIVLAAAASLAGYQELCRELAASGPGTFGELDTTGARSVLRRYSDAWFAAARRRKKGDATARFPRRRRGLVPVRWYAGTFSMQGRVLRIPVAKGCPPLRGRLDRDVPYPAGRIRSVTLGIAAGRLYADVTAEIPVAVYPEGEGPDGSLVAGIDLGVRATRAATARTMMANMMVGLPDAVGLPASRLPPAVAPVDRDHPRFAPGRQAPGDQGYP